MKDTGRLELISMMPHDPRQYLRSIYTTLQLHFVAKLTHPCDVTALCGVDMSHETKCGDVEATWGRVVIDVSALQCNLQCSMNEPL